MAECKYELLPIRESGATKDLESGSEPNTPGFEHHSAPASPTTRNLRKESDVSLFDTSASYGHKKNLRRRQARLNSQLLHAAESGDVVTFNKCLSLGACSNATCWPLKVSVLQVAALTGQEAMMRTLLERGADASIADTNGRTALHLAAWCGSVACLDALLENGCDVNRRTKAPEDISSYMDDFKDSPDHNHNALGRMLPVLETGQSPLHVACQKGNLGCVQRLVAAAADIEATNERGLKPLEVAGDKLVHDEDAARRYYEIVQILLDAAVTSTATATAPPDDAPSGIRLFSAGLFPAALGRFLSDQEQKPRFHFPSQKRPKFGSTLHTAVALRSSDTVRMLMEAGVPLELKNRDGDTALHLAVRSKLYEILEQLLEAKNCVDGINVTDKDGKTPLMLAVESAWRPGVDLLLESEASVTVACANQATVVHEAAKKGEDELLADLLDEEDSSQVINLLDSYGNSPLHHAVRSQSLDCVELLLNAGADPQIKSPQSTSVLHLAASLGYSEILSTLLSQKAFGWVNSTDDLGRTPLHCAAKFGHTKCATVLLGAGADVSLETSSGCTPIQEAAADGHSETLEVLLKEVSHALLDKADCLGHTALHKASYQGSRECVVLLLDAGADLSSSDNEGRTILETILNNIPQPVSFLEDVLDSRIKDNGKPPTDRECEVTLDFRILSAREGDKQMNVVKSLLNTGNEHRQEFLLIHPLVETFIFLKWRKLRFFFCILIILYVTFVLSLSMLVSAIYYFHTLDESAHSVLVNTSRCILLISLSCIVVTEFWQALNLGIYYFKEYETWVKITCVPLSIVVASCDHGEEWVMHVTTLAILLSWMELMFLMSRFPTWGYYALMFSKVAMNVVKVLITFVFLVIGFAFSFFVQFRDKPSFSSPWEAFVKTLVMVTAEFDYESLFETARRDQGFAGTSRIIFLVFVILAAIVLMNLMVGLAVSDINGLKNEGKIRKLQKQTDFICVLEQIAYHKTLMSWLPVKIKAFFEHRRQLKTQFLLYPAVPKTKSIFNMHLPRILQDSIISRTVKSKKRGRRWTLHDVYQKLDQLATRNSCFGNDEHDDNCDKTIAGQESSRAEMSGIANVLKSLEDMKLLSDTSCQELTSQLKTLKSLLLQHNDRLFKLESVVDAVGQKVDVCNRKLDSLLQHRKISVSDATGESST